MRPQKPAREMYGYLDADGVWNIDNPEDVRAQLEWVRNAFWFESQFRPRVRPELVLIALVVLSWMPIVGLVLLIVRALS